MTNPLWVLKTRLQTAGSAGEPLASAGACAAGAPLRDLSAAALVRREGARALLRGVAPALLLVSYNALQLPLYAAARTELGLTNFPAVLGSVSIASLATYPLQVIRTRFQAERVGAAAAAAGRREYGTFASVLRHTVRAEGGVRRGLYKGCSAHLVRSVLGWFVRFEVAERCARAAGALQ